MLRKWVYSFDMSEMVTTLGSIAWYLKWRYDDDFDRVALMSFYVKSSFEPHRYKYEQYSDVSKTDRWADMESRYVLTMINIQMSFQFFFFWYRLKLKPPNLWWYWMPTDDMCPMSQWCFLLFFSQDLFCACFYCNFRSQKSQRDLRRRERWCFVCPRNKVREAVDGRYQEWGTDRETQPKEGLV